VASLWSVNDGSTALLMNHFYGGLGEGLAPVEALRKLRPVGTDSSEFNFRNRH